MAAIHLSFHCSSSSLLFRSGPYAYDFFHRLNFNPSPISFSFSPKPTPSRHLIHKLRTHIAAKPDQTTPTSRCFVLVHGGGHGGWVWYKLATLLSESGHRFTAPDLAASGINPKRVEEVKTFEEYCEPLMEVMEAVPADERVVLVGHSYGGIPAALAMERFPHKIAAAVFVSASMPSTTNLLPSIIKKLLDGRTRKSITMDPKFLRDTLYHLCSPEDITLASLLLRPSKPYNDSTIRKENFLTTENHGSVPRVYIVCNQDKAISRETQIWMAEMSPGTEVLELDEADHMPMLAMPKELFTVLIDISDRYQ